MEQPKKRKLTTANKISIVGFIVIPIALFLFEQCTPRETQVAQAELEEVDATIHIPTATIIRVWAEYNVYENNLRGMRINTRFTVQNMLNRTGSVSVWFYNKDGSKLMSVSGNSRFKTVGGQVTVWGYFRPDFQDAIFSNDGYFRLFMPYNEFGISSGGRTDLWFQVGIFDDNNNQIEISNSYPFWIEL